MRGSHRHHLHWLCWQPTHYNDFLFRSLAADPAIELTVHFTERVVASHPWRSELGSGFRSRTYRRVLGLDWRLLRLAVLDRRSLFVIGGWHDPTMVAVINLLGLRRRPFAVWTDTPDVQRYRSPLKRALRAIWLRKIFRRARYVMGTGRPALSILEEMGCPSHKLVNFPFFVDLHAFAPAPKADLKASRPLTVFVSCGRLVNAQKGYDLALRALSLASAKARASCFTYRIAGIGPDKAALETLAKRLGMGEKIEFVGWLEPRDLPDFYRTGDVFIHPSRVDPYPNAVLEAMASGLPVIGSDLAGSVVDRITHGQNGLVHRADDVEDLAENIAYALSDPARLRIMGAAARRAAESWPVTRATETIKAMLANL